MPEVVLPITVLMSVRLSNQLCGLYRCLSPLGVRTRLGDQRDKLHIAASGTNQRLEVLFRPVDNTRLGQQLIYAVCHRENHGTGECWKWTCSMVPGAALDEWRGGLSQCNVDHFTNVASPDQDLT